MGRDCQPKWLHYQGHLLRVPQIHQLLRRAGATQEGSRDWRLLRHQQGRARLLVRGKLRRWLAEMAGARLIIERFANISDGTIPGVRAPFLRVGGNTQFEMMADQFFAYDASITPLARVPQWPYTLYFRMPHKCHGNA